MNLSALQTKLLAAARRNPPGDAVPYAFEKRVLARIAGSVAGAPTPMEWLAWSRVLWMGAAACSAIALAMSVWSPPVAEDGGTSFSEGVEQTIMAASDELDSAW